MELQNSFKIPFLVEGEFQLTSCFLTLSWIPPDGWHLDIERDNAIYKSFGESPQ